MKYAFIVLALGAFALTGCNNSQSSEETTTPITTEVVNNPETASAEPTVAPEDLPVIEFESDLHEFGEITQGEKVEHTFKFKNTGKTDLVITSAKGSCGCTVPTWPRTPIAPGAEDVIEVVFDSNGKKGTQHKKVTIVANTQPATTVLAIKGTVIAPDAETAQQ